MSKPIGFHPTTGLIVIQDNDNFPARSLTAEASTDWPGRIQIHNLAGRSVQNVMWSDVTSLDLSYVPASFEDALAYLRGEFGRSPAGGETFGVATVAEADLIQGQPVAVSRATGRLLPARADTYTLAFVAGLASADTMRGFADRPLHGAMTLPDWTAVAGAPTLAPGQTYFLGPSGGLTRRPRPDTACVVRIGLATAADTLVVDPSPPTLL